MMITIASFETMAERAARASSEEPYSDEFIKRCREKAQEYDREEWPLRTALLRELKQCSPYHFRRMILGEERENTGEVGIDG